MLKLFSRTVVMSHRNGVLNQRRRVSQAYGNVSELKVVRNNPSALE